MANSIHSISFSGSEHNHTSAATSSSMETLSSTTGDGSNPPKEEAAAGKVGPDGDGSKKNPSITGYYDLLARPDAASYLAELEKELFDDYIDKVAPKLRPIAADDSVKRFYKLCNNNRLEMGFRGLLHPEILVSMVSKNAVRCARAVLRGTAPEMRSFSVDPNARHQYGFAPLHVAAEMFSTEMVRLLLRYGASANIRTRGTKVIEGLLPLNVGVENASMHKYLEDNWEDGDPVENLIFLLCLPEMKMYLDTVRLIAKHTDNIVDELWNYIEKEKLVQASILLLAAQKQLRVKVNTRSGFDDVKCRTDEAARALHREGLAMVKEEKNSAALRKLKDKKEALLTADSLIGIVHRAGEPLEELIEKFQTHSEVLPISDTAIFKVQT
ncbi:unnamed protein product [Urochloa humidicola]